MLHMTCVQRKEPYCVALGRLLMSAALLGVCCNACYAASWPSNACYTYAEESHQRWHTLFFSVIKKIISLSCRSPTPSPSVSVSSAGAFESLQNLTSLWVTKYWVFWLHVRMYVYLCMYVCMYVCEGIDRCFCVVPSLDRAKYLTNWGLCLTRGRFEENSHQDLFH